jgi:sugar phosphate isomerase/epimerase
MIRPGLVSVTFRQLIPSEIVRLAYRAGLEGIEWGGDVHVPPGDLDNACDVRSLTTDAGLKVVSYGSYYRVGSPHANEAPFSVVLETALALGAPAIRVWAGVVGSNQTDEATYQAIVTDLQKIGKLAERAGMGINIEFHRGTYADQYKTAVRLQRCVNQANVRLYWQPDPLFSHSVRLKGLHQVAPYLSNLHVFQWESSNKTTIRRPLSTGKEEWMQYLNLVDDPGIDHYALMEFVREDSPEQLIVDADALKIWLRALRPIN